MTATYGKIVLFLCCMLINTLRGEGCSADQQGTTTLTASTGTFPAADINKPLPFDVSCQWTITAPQGKVLRLEITALFTASCSDEYLKIFDGPSAASKLIAKYCGDNGVTGTDYFISTSQSLWLEMKSGIRNNTYMLGSYKTLDFNKDCSPNTTLDAPQWPVEHNFSSPYWPHGYRINTTCGWYITAPADHIVKLHITSELAVGSDKVQAFDVDDSKLSLISRSIHDFGIVYSKLQVIFVLFETNAYRNKKTEKGIFISYTSILPAAGSACTLSNTEDQNMNILLNDSSGVIKTPGYPSNYPHILINSCIWKIIAPKGNIIKIAFSSIRLYQYDCVYVYDKINSFTPLLDNRCGSKVSFTVYSSGRELMVKTTGRYTNTTGPGFIANYTMLPAASPGTCVMDQNSMIQLSAEGRTFHTPGYPVHPGVGKCSWNITVPAGMFVKLTLQAGQCKKTVAEVFDGPSTTSKSLGKFCNWYQKEVVYSSGNHLLVRFRSKTQDDPAGGLLAWYAAVPAVPSSYACSTNTNEWSPIQLDGPENHFASYDFPLSYPNGARCLWEIESPVGSAVQITFHSFDLQQTDKCEADYVEIREGEYSWRTDLIGRYCGSSSSRVVTSSQTKVFVEFVSDMIGRYPGFNATAKAIQNSAMGACKKQGVDNVITLTNETGRLFSPLFPRPYPKNMKCTWIITVPEEHFVKLRITSFDLSTSCNDAYLEIRDGDSYSSKLLKKFCYIKYDISVFSSSRHLWVRFESVHTFSEPGFNAVFEAVKEVPASFSCVASNYRTRLTSDSGNLASYNYPVMYDDPIECVWVISTSMDKHIKLSFDFFNLRSSPDCADDYVEVRDGMFDTSELVGKYCGADKPSSITSDDWDLHITFKSSGKGKYPGFKATYEVTNTVAATLKIVGYVVGGLSALCAIAGASYKCYLLRKDDHETEGTGDMTSPEAAPLQQETTKV